MDTLTGKRNTIIALLVAMLLCASFYYIYQMQVDTIRDIRIISNSVLLGLCLFGSALLLSDPQCPRSRKIFALQILMVAIASMFTIIRIITWGNAATSYSGVLIYDNISAMILLAYPFELLYHRQAKLWRYTRVTLFTLLIVVIYWGHVSLSSISGVEQISHVLNTFHRFEIWFQMLILIYLALVLMVIMRLREPKGEQNKTDNIDLRKHNYYLLAYFLILTSYIIIAELLNYQNSFINGFVLVTLSCSSFYKTASHKLLALSPSGEAASWVNTQVESNSVNPDLASKYVAEDKYRFVDKISQYKLDLERWMQEQQPYKNKDFKLEDVMQVLPLNRSYISHLFNEGYGETFFNFVMRYRIDESVRLLENNQEMNIKRISDICGFSSPSVFGRAFMKNKGVTPKQYRTNLGK